MLNFKQFVEELYIPNRKQSKGISRANMPQIPDEHSEHFINVFIKKLGVKVRVKTVDPETLKPTQNEFSDKGIQKNMGRIGKGYAKPPIIVSKDNYIMDGHHRWAAHANSKVKIKIRQVDMHSSELLEVMKRYSKVNFKDIYND